MNAGLLGMAGGPQRIVCLTEETTEWLYLLGEERRIAGISGYTVRPRRARDEKPKVSAFTSAKLDKILALEPDLVLGFSDMQADIAAALIRAGLPVMVFNQRSVAQIADMLAQLAALVGAAERGQALLLQFEERLALIQKAVQAQFALGKRRPRIYFEEWDEPPISGIRWVSELIGIAGGEDVFLNSRPSRWARTASLPTRWRSCGERPTSSSARGAARSFAPRRSPRAPAGRTCPPCGTASCSRSSPPTSCSPDRRR